MQKKDKNESFSNLNKGESNHWTMNFMGISSPRHHDSLIDPSLFIIKKSMYTYTYTIYTIHTRYTYKDPPTKNATVMLTIFQPVERHAILKLNCPYSQ